MSLYSMGSSNICFTDSIINGTAMDCFYPTLDCKTHIVGHDGSIDLKLPGPLNISDTFACSLNICLSVCLPTSASLHHLAKSSGFRLSM